MADRAGERRKLGKKMWMPVAMAIVLHSSPRRLSCHARHARAAVHDFLPALSQFRDEQAGHRFMQMHEILLGEPSQMRLDLVARYLVSEIGHAARQNRAIERVGILLVQQS